MTLQHAAIFPHRRNRDGSFDSICMTCFRTVATKYKETELNDAEKDHTCERSAVAQRGGGPMRVPSLRSTKVG